jgi:hypothetical protein
MFSTTMRRQADFFCGKNGHAFIAMEFLEGLTLKQDRPAFDGN